MSERRYSGPRAPRGSGKGAETSTRGFFDLPDVRNPWAAPRIVSRFKPRATTQELVFANGCVLGMAKHPFFSNLEEGGGTVLLPLRVASWQGYV